MTVAEIVAAVRELDDASTRLKGWLEHGGSCCPDVPRVHGYCTRKACIGRREHAAVLWATKAAHHANRIAALVDLDVLSGDAGTAATDLDAPSVSEGS
jgi:hypothetical protein